MKKMKYVQLMKDFNKDGLHGDIGIAKNHKDELYSVDLIKGGSVEAKRSELKSISIDTIDSAYQLISLIQNDGVELTKELQAELVRKYIYLVNRELNKR